MLISAKFSGLAILLILAAKFIIGIIVGFTADIILRKKNAEKEQDIHSFCEREHCDCDDGIFVSALKHTLKITLIILVISIILHFLPWQNRRGSGLFPRVICIISARILFVR